MLQTLRSVWARYAPLTVTFKSVLDALCEDPECAEEQKGQIRALASGLAGSADYFLTKTRQEELQKAINVRL
jgi:hypothetical protein